MNVRLRSGGALVQWLVPGLLFIASAAGVVVGVRTEITALRYRVVHLLDRESGLRAQVEQLRIEVAALTSPDRIERAARALGLSDPRPGQVRTISGLETAESNP